MNKKPCSEYEEGYTEAISDLHRGFYEDWVKELDGDYVGMCEGLISAKRGKEEER